MFLLKFNVIAKVRRRLPGSQYTIRFLTIFMACACLNMAAAPGWADETPLIIRLSAHIKPDMPVYASIQQFKADVEQASQGSVIIELHHSAELFKDSQAGDAVSSGAVDMAFVNLSRYAAKIPVTDAFQLPFLLNTDEIGDAAVSPGSEMRRLTEEAILAQAGSRILWWVPLGQTVFLSREASVADPESIFGKNVRTFGPVAEAMVTGCGGVPRDIDGQAMEKAFELREVEAGMTPITSVVGRKLWRFMDTITRTNHANWLAVMAINDKMWQGLSADQRAILTEAATKADVTARSIAADTEAKAYKDLAENHGMKIATLSQEQLQHWRMCSTDVLLHFMERAGPAGEEFMLAYGRMRKHVDSGERTLAAPR